MADVETSSQYRHGMLPEFTAEEASRQEFVKSLKLHLAHKVAPGNKIAYERNLLPRFEKEHGRAPKSPIPLEPLTYPESRTPRATAFAHLRSVLGPQ